MRSMDTQEEASVQARCSVEQGGVGRGGAAARAAASSSSARDMDRDREERMAMITEMCVLNMSRRSVFGQRVKVITTVVESDQTKCKAKGKRKVDDHFLGKGPPSTRHPHTVPHTSNFQTYTLNSRFDC